MHTGRKGEMEMKTGYWGQRRNNRNSTLNLLGISEEQLGKSIKTLDGCLKMMNNILQLNIDAITDVTLLYIDRKFHNLMDGLEEDNIREHYNEIYEKTIFKKLNSLISPRVKRVYQESIQSRRKDNYNPKAYHHIEERARNPVKCDLDREIALAQELSYSVGGGSI